MSGYPETLKYFMWAYQVYYASCCKTSAKSLFNHFDRGLKPHVFLIGLSSSKEPLLCFEPEDHDNFQKDFGEFKKVVDHFLEADPNKNMLYSGPGMQEEMDGRRSIEAFRKSIEKIITDSDQNTEGRQYFASTPASVGGYHVFVLLGLVKDVYESHKHLNQAFWNERFPMSTSLLQSAIDVYLEDKEKNIYLPNAGKNLGQDFQTTDELLRRAAAKFMFTIGIKGNEIEGMHGLLDNCNHISTYRYEQHPNNGHLIICNETDPSIQYTVKLKDPFPLSDLRKTRKMLQLSDVKMGVISDAKNVYGIGEVAKSYDAANESIFEIYFEDTYCWTVKHQQNVILQMRFGLPEFPSEAINKTKFYSDLRRVFAGISDPELDNLLILAVAATNQVGGAMLIICRDAEQEALRLEKQSLVIEPQQLTPELVLKLSLIDGGILLDTSGKAYAHGVILDGIVSKTGDSARGSRYNSGITYQQYRGAVKPTCLVIVSEDGMVDIVPKLRPQIKHADITAAIEGLEEVFAQERPEVPGFNKLMSFFGDIRFYLTEAECIRINELRKAIEEKQGFLTVRIVHSDLSPDPEMNDSFYLSE